MGFGWDGLTNQAREKTNKLGIRRAMFVRKCEKERTKKKRNGKKQTCKE